ncbi:MAG: hypothetical protein NC548_35275 [Lachnospiraceae bacterium]|nr:hypothetical protein [Lachnospiraceae bacterium]
MDAHPDKSIGKVEETRKESGGREMPPGSSAKAPVGSKKGEARKSGAKGKKKENTDKQEKDQDQQVFSFRASLSDIDRWKFFVAATSQTMQKMATNALNEYVRKYKLSEPEMAVFEALKARKNAEMQTEREERADGKS